MGRIIIPEVIYEPGESDSLIFLAGPIGCARGWRNNAIRMLFSGGKNIVVVSPQKDLDFNLLSYVVNMSGSSRSRQREWERKYLKVASESGVVMFWLPERETSNFIECYGGMTRKELGDWTTEKKYNSNVRLVIGTDGNFPYGRTLEYDILQDLPNFHICRTLKETCDAAIELAVQ